MSIKIKDTAISLFGIVSSQIILFACFTLIGRYWGAEELGSLNFNLSLGMFLGTVMAFRYELSCVQDNHEESYSAFAHTILISLVSLLFIFLIIRLWDITGGTIIATFAATFIVQQASSLYLNTLRKYVIIALIKNVSSLGFILSLSIFASLNKTPNVFEIYTQINLFISVLILFVIVKKSPSVKINTAFLMENIKFPKYTLPATILSSALVYSLPIVIPVIYGNLTAGFFAVTQRFGFFPVSLTAQSISGIFRRELISSLNKEYGIAVNVYKSHARLLAGAALLYIILGNFLFGPLIEILLGSGWDKSVTFFQILSPLYALQIIYIPLSQIFIATHSQKTDLIVQSIIFCCASIALATSYLFSIEVAKMLMLFSASGAIALMIGIWLTYKTMQSFSVFPVEPNPYTR